MFEKKYGESLNFYFKLIVFVLLRAGMVMKNKRKDGKIDDKKSQNKSKKIMAVPHPDKNWRYKKGVWYYVKENKYKHQGDYHSKFLLPAIKKWRQSHKKIAKRINKEQT